MQIDMAVLCVMTDEQMSNYISSYEDHEAVRSFCEQTNADKCSLDNKTLLQRLRDRIGTRKMKSKGVLSHAQDMLQKTSEGMSRWRNAAAEQTFRKSEIVYFILELMNPSK